MDTLFPVPELYQHWGCRINDRTLWSGMRTFILQNDLLQIVVLEDKGAEIIQFIYKPAGLQTTIENGSSLQLAARASLRAWLTAVAFLTQGEVAGIEQDGCVTFSSQNHTD